MPLLVALSGDSEGAQRALFEERRRGDDCFKRLEVELVENGGDGASVMADILRKIGEYRNAASELMGGAGRPDSLKRYHVQVYPLLRLAVRVCGAIR